MSIGSLQLRTPCIITALSLNAEGYGQITIGGQKLAAHRLAYTMAYGDPPPGMIVRHLCGNRACINALHLERGDHLSNAADREAHGRTAKGERHGCAKLNEADVSDIRSCLAAGAKGRDLAKRFGVSESTISLIKRGKKWNSCP